MHGLEPLSNLILICFILALPATLLPCGWIMNSREGKTGARTDRGVLLGPTAGHAGQTNKIHLSHSAKAAFLELMAENRGPERQRVSPPHSSLLPLQGCGPAPSALKPCPLFSVSVPLGKPLNFWASMYQYYADEGKRRAGIAEYMITTVVPQWQSA